MNQELIIRDNCHIFLLEINILPTPIIVINLISFRQDGFMKNYLNSQRDNIFCNVEVLIYVFDVESEELGKYFH